jgi:hypothetical protein
LPDAANFVPSAEDAIEIQFCAGAVVGVNC